MDSIEDLSEVERNSFVYKLSKAMTPRPAPKIIYVEKGEGDENQGNKVILPDGWD